MVVMAWKGGKMDASLRLEPPECVYEENNSVVARNLMKAKVSKLLMEVDEDYAIRLAGNPNTSNLHAECQIRVYPGNSSIEVNVNTGVLRPNKAQTYTRTVKETLTFNGSSSANLYYPPSGASIGAKKVSASFVDQWGRNFDPDIRVFGDNITAVDWESKNNYRNPTKRAVFRDEVCIADMFGNAIPCYGAIEVTYVTSYWRAEYSFDYDWRSRKFNDPSFVAVLRDSNGDQTSSLTLSGPTTRGTY